ncbi:MAG: hypothetical protein A4E19_12710 [Nitrospira sp. SG-bin1]|nr:MAG: hypothetical protein A4E19_12710 [Nitrospira sp. SG-bin1]
MPDEPVLTATARRARRQLRREKQREANVGRAANMHKARITGKLDARQDSAGRASKVNIGCSGWFYWHWRGRFYPADMPTKEWFAYYARHFKTVELNAPFYAWPTVATIQSWRRQAGRRNFVYTVKVCELITHVKRFQGTKQLIADFGLIADMLGPMMGCFLFQLPPSFHYTPARLSAILGQLDHRRRNVVEFRHPSWWNETVFSAFRDTGTIFCSCSGPRLPDDVIKTSEDIYVRFHGTQRWYRHNYSKAELTLWATRLCDSGAKRVWAYFNNDRNGYAIRNAKALSRLLQNEAKGRYGAD